MSGIVNQKLRKFPITTHELSALATGPSRDLFNLNRRIDPKRGYEQTIVAREIALGRYINADDHAFDVLPRRLFIRGLETTLEAMLNHGIIRIKTISYDPNLNQADLPDTAHSPYILVQHNELSTTSLPITLGQRALVFRASLDPYANLRRYRSCIRIDDPDGFVSCVTEKLEQVWSEVGGRIVRVLHAPCFYQWSRLVGTWRDRAVFDESLGLPEDAKYFIKPGYGFHDAEFRFVWILDQDFEGHVDIQCPELPQFCSAFSEVFR
jgi:hypothetical protein